MADSDITVEILKDIRSEIRTTNQRLGTVEEQLGDVRNEIRTTNQRLGTVEEQLGGVQQQLVVMGTALLDLAEQQRFVVRYTKAPSERDVRLEGRVSSLESRVDKLESK